MSQDTKKHAQSTMTVGQVDEAGKLGETAVLENNFGWVDRAKHG